MSNNVIYSINGPVVKVKDTVSFSMLEMVYVGNDSLMGEVISISKEFTTIQVYETTTGLKPGEPVVSTGSPICATLGPGILRNIFDGIERPLKALEEQTGAFIQAGSNVDSLDVNKKWDVTMTVKVGDYVKGGDIYATLPETDLIVHKCMVSPLISGKVVEVANDGQYTVNDVVMKIEDDQGKIIECTLCQKWPIKQARPTAKRLPISIPLVTGQRVIDALFPIAKGGTAAIPGGFGTGKTMTQHQIAKWCDADIIVYVGCGERGNEMTEVLTEFPYLEDPKTGNPLMDRTVLIANTSNMPVAAREACVYTGITIAEFYRDQGYDVALMADSTSRWAEAMREISGRLEEMPGEEGYPAYLASRLAQFYERAGRVDTIGTDPKVASITVVGAVSPPGGDLSEPVTQNTLRICKVFWALDASLADKRHFPSIDWLQSYSLYIDSIEGWWHENIAEDWRAVRDEAMVLLQKESELQEIVQLVGPDALPETDQATLETTRMLREDFLQQNAFDDIDTYCAPLKQYKMLKTILLFQKEAQAAIAKGTPIQNLTSLPVKEEIGKMKFVPQDEFDAKVESIQADIIKQCSEA